MKPIIQFYKKLHSYLIAEFDEESEIKEIVAMAQKVSPSCNVTHASINFLEECVNRPSQIEDDEVWMGTKEEFMINAFKDLSPLKDERAMETFHDLWKVVLTLEEEDFYWARTVKSRPDGSAVIVLHVSSEEAFRKLVSENSLREVEEGVIITH